MNTSSCEQLDDYLFDWLSEIQRSEFEAHLAGCDQCRRNVEQQRRIDHLLARAVERLEPVPLSLIDSVETRIHSFRRRRAMQLAWGVSTGIVLALFVGVWSTIPLAKRATRNDNEIRVDAVHDGPATKLAGRSEDPVRVTLSDPSAAILVPVTTESANVSIVWVYPALKPSDDISRNDHH